MYRFLYNLGMNSKRAGFRGEVRKSRDYDVTFGVVTEPVFGTERLGRNGGAKSTAREQVTR